MTSQSLRWDGAAITRRMREAQKLGINATMSEAAQHARNNHTWQNRQGRLEASINIVEPAREDAAGVVGTWGSTDVRYALIHELGGVIVPVRARALKIPQPDGTFRFVKSVRIPARPYLRPAADAIYPKLAGKIRAAFERASGASQGGPSDA
jgi:phage gpG-like protein